MYVTLSPAKRQVVEGVVLWLLILSSTIAVLTTIAIFAAALLAAALLGIAGLAASRAIDETMIALSVVSKYRERYG